MGNKTKLAPSHNNRAGYKTLQQIHEDLKVYKLFRMMATTFIAQESTVLGGDRRLYPEALGVGSLTLMYCSQRALAAILDHINFNGLDALVTIRHWNNYEFKDYNATLQYQPPADQNNNSCEVFDIKFDLIDMQEI